MSGAVVCAIGCGAAEPRGHDDRIPRECVIEGRSPESIADVVERVNALPRPVSVACFVASLPRPLAVVASSSEFSAQPAVGAGNPRLFILSEGLAMSIVPAGEGSHLLELGEWVSDTRTIKAELRFPVEAAISHDTPYEVLLDGGITTCGLCHRNETPAPDRPGAYVSEAMRPASNHYVPLADLHDELDACDRSAEPARCELLSALLDFGLVEEVAFSDELATFFN
ncbi:hypothetical protein [Enhygromyxa salina]|uniref:hypothetical protein n=1 Tax=Enhygromyxa salina TaxID=215803 RepID=UPI0015E5D6B7|nr:hypothetical protein [Enhygromyxa salina]